MTTQGPPLPSELWARIILSLFDPSDWIDFLWRHYCGIDRPDYPGHEEKRHEPLRYDWRRLSLICKSWKEVVDIYLATQVSGQVAPFKARIDNGTWTGYYENSKKLEVDTGIISKALPITHNRTIYDTSVCSTYTEIIVNSTTDPYVIGTQLRYANHLVNRVDSIVTKPGDWLFNVTGYAYWVTQENWGPIPKEKQDTRTTIRRAADAYLDCEFN